MLDLTPTLYEALMERHAEAAKRAWAPHNHWGSWLAAIGYAVPWRGKGAPEMGREDFMPDWAKAQPGQSSAAPSARPSKATLRKKFEALARIRCGASKAAKKRAGRKG